MCGGIDTISRLILCCGGYLCAASFKDLSIDQSLIDSVMKDVKEMDENDRFFETFKKLTAVEPQHFKFKSGLINSIRNIFKQISSHANAFCGELEKSFIEDPMQTTILQLPTQSTSQIIQRKRVHNDRENESRKRLTQQIDLAGKGLEKLVTYLDRLLRAADPGFEPQNIELVMIPQKSSDTKIAYTFNCSHCRASLTLYLEDENNNIKLRVWNLLRHFYGKHPEFKANIQNHLVNIEKSFLKSFILILKYFTITGKGKYPRNSTTR